MKLTLILGSLTPKHHQETTAQTKFTLRICGELWYGEIYNTRLQNISFSRVLVWLYSVSLFLLIFLCVTTRTITKGKAALHGSGL